MGGPGALIVGGTAAIGRAAARRLIEEGFDVTVVSRSGAIPDELTQLGVRSMQADRTVTGELEAVLGDGVDVLVDVVAFTPSDADQVLEFVDRLGSAVVISSASVYCDDDGRKFDGATSVDTFPRFPVPIPETHRTVEPSDASYSSRKVAIENALLGGETPATLIRASAVHGPGATLPRELFFVRRALDGRRRVVLVSDGQSRFHTTSVENLAELIVLAARRPGTRVLNCGDPNPPSVREIGTAIGAAIDHEFELVGIPDDGYERPDLSNPWAVPLPVVVDMSAAERELGYKPVTTYAEAVRATCEWLIPHAYDDWSATYLASSLDYSAEDEKLRELLGDRRPG